MATDIEQFLALSVSQVSPVEADFVHFGLRGRLRITVVMGASHCTSGDAMLTPHPAG